MEYKTTSGLCNNCLGNGCGDNLVSSDSTYIYVILTPLITVICYRNKKIKNLSMFCLIDVLHFITPILGEP